MNILMLRKHFKANFANNYKNHQTSIEKFVCLQSSNRKCGKKLKVLLAVEVVIIWLFLKNYYCILKMLKKLGFVIVIDKQFIKH